MLPYAITRSMSRPVDYVVNIEQYPLHDIVGDMQRRHPRTRIPGNCAPDMELVQLEVRLEVDRKCCKVA
jgi:hypothetical protein